VLSLSFIYLAWRFVRRPERREARTLFLGSIVYLPLVLAALALDGPVRVMLAR